MDNSWMNRRSRIYWYDQYAINEQATAFAKYDPDRIAQEMIGTGADIVAVYATNQFGIAYYPSKLWPQHPGLKGRDYVGEVSERLRRAGKKVILYTNWLDSKHPEWWVKPVGQERPAAPGLVSWADPKRPNRSVRNVPGGGWRGPCFNSPHREQIIEIAREVTETYRPDGFHLDMFSFGAACSCEFCLPALWKICGTDNITHDALAAHWNDYIDWLHERTTSLMAEVSAVARANGAITAHNEFAPVLNQASLGTNAQWLTHLDVFLSECFDAFLSPATDLNSTSLVVKWQHGINKPSWILRTSGQFQYAHWPISKAQWELYGAACKANGCKAFGPCGIGARPDTTSAPSMLEHVKHGFDFYMKDADLDEGAESAARAGLMFSWQTRKYCPPGAESNRWMEELAGWNRLLMEEHLPFDVIVAEDGELAKKLNRYELVILPGITQLTDAACEAMREFVRRGGRMIATGDTSLGEGRGKMRADFGLRDVLGVSRKGSVEGHFAIERNGDGEPATGTFQQVTTKGHIGAYRMETDPAGSVGGVKDPLPMQRSEWPVYCTNEVGKGRATYVAFELGRFFEAHGDEHIGGLMKEIVDSMLPARPIRVKAPRTLEVMVYRQPGDRTIIHLANRTVPWSLPTLSRQFTEVIPLHDVEIEVDSTVRNPKVSAREAKVFSKAEGGTLRIHVEKVGAYAAVMIEPGT